MLYELHVKDMALIREAGLEFGEGLHILTGETGAGKSLLLGSINLALGGKKEGGIIRKGADCATAQLVFSPEGDSLERLAQLDIHPDEDGNLILTRSIGEKRGSCRINSETVPLSRLKEAASLLIDIHGQHEHQSLLRKSNHIRMLDEYIGEEMTALTDRIAQSYSRYREAVDELSSQTVDEGGRQRELSLLEYEINEIRSAALKEGEEDELTERYRVLSNVERIKQALGEVSRSVATGSPVSEALSKAVRDMGQISSLDSALGDIESSLAGAEDCLSEAARGISAYMDSLDLDREELYNTEKRLELYGSIRRKYGPDPKQVEEYAARSEERRARLLDFEGYMENLRLRADEAEKELLALCEEASDKRRKGALRLADEIIRELSELNFLDARFEVRVEPLGDYTSRGRDDVEFLISMNPGEEVKPLSQVASGGELSRIMLALRTVSALKDGIDTLIFDEIDAGISGVTASMVAKKLSRLARGRQVICITHLPQIAACADRHYRIEKSASADETTTVISSGGEKELMEELVRLLGGTPSAEETARELRSAALADKEKP